MEYKLFLDDKHNPVHCIGYMHSRIGRRNPIYLENGWLIARSYEAFKNTITEHGLPIFVSFDHDLADEHYRKFLESDQVSYEDFEEKTGYECAKWMVDYCITNKKKLPEYAVHSMNPVGAQNIIKYLENSKKWINL